MDDDFNTAGAIGTLFDMSKDVNTLLNSGEPVSRVTLQAIDDLYREMGEKILGIIPDALAEEAAAGLDEALIELLLELRAQARVAKQWAQSDWIRDRLAALNIVIEDRAEGTTWHIAR